MLRHRRSERGDLSGCNDNNYKTNNNNDNNIITTTTTVTTNNHNNRVVGFLDPVGLAQWHP